MKPILVAPLIAIVLAGAGVGAYLAVAGAGSGEEAVVAQATPTPTPEAQAAAAIIPTPTPTPAPAPSETPVEAGQKGGGAVDGETPTSTLQTYRNGKYGYTVTLPEGWRVASSFMEAFAQVRSDPRTTRVPEDWVVLTSLSQSEEQQFIDDALQRPGGLTGLEPWLEFALLDSVAVFPIEADLATYVTDVVEGNVIRTVTDVREEVLDSGQVVIRLTRREQDDRGDFTYDTVYVPFTSGSCPGSGASCKGMIVRIAMAGRTNLEDPAGQPPPENPDYAKEEFETIFRSFRDE